MDSHSLYSSAESIITTETCTTAKQTTRVVFKRFRAATADAFLEMYLHESASEKTEGVVKFYGQEFKQGSLGMRLEWCAGGSLEMDMTRKAERQVRYDKEYIIKQTFHLLTTLSTLHSARISHRNINIFNLLVTGSGEIKITDFGSAKLIKTTETVDAHTIKNCRSEVAPDVMKACDQFDPAVVDPFKLDVWALGKVLLEMICLRHIENLNKFSEADFTRIVTERLQSNGFESLACVLLPMMAFEDVHRITAAEALQLIRKQVDYPELSVTSSTDSSSPSTLTRPYTTQYCPQCIVTDTSIQFCPACRAYRSS